MMNDVHFLFSIISIIEKSITCCYKTCLLINDDMSREKKVVPPPQWRHEGGVLENENN
jgi:hypothetical protein